MPPAVRAVGVAAHRAGGRGGAGVPRRQGAGPVRDVPAGRPGPGPSRPAAARRAERRPGRARARGRARGLPAVGVPARGDPPGAVRRGALAARAHRRPGRRPARRRRGEPVDGGSSGTAPATSLSAVAAALRGQPGPSLAEALQSPEQQARARRGHRGDVAARRPRRRRDGRRRPRGRPDGRRHPHAASSAGASSPAGSRPRYDGCSGWTRSCASTATGRPSSAAWSTGSAWPASTGCGTPPPRCPTAAELAAPRALGGAGSAGVSGPDPAVAQVRLAVRGGADGAASRGTSSWWRAAAVPDSLALAAAVAFEAPRLAVRAGAVVVDHGLQDGSADVAAAAARALARARAGPGRGRRPSTVGAHGGGPEAAARSARYAALDAAADRLGAATVLLGAHPRRPGRDRAARLARGSGARSLAGMPPGPATVATGARCSSVDRATTRRACAAEGLRAVGRPAQHRPALRPVPGPPRRAAGAGARARARGGRRPRPVGRRWPAPTPTRSTQLAATAAGRGRRTGRRPRRRRARRDAARAAQPGPARGGARRRLPGGRAHRRPRRAVDALVVGLARAGPVSTCPEVSPPAAPVTGSGIAVSGAGEGGRSR